MPLALIDLKRTLYDPENGCLEGGAKEFLAGLKARGFRLALVAKAGGIEEGKLKALGIAGFFDFVSLAEEKSLGQFKEVMEKAGVKASECVAVGDRVKKEIRIGKQLGMKTVWLKRGKFSEERPESYLEKPDFIVESLEAALKAIDSLAL